MFWIRIVDKIVVTCLARVLRHLFWEPREEKSAKSRVVAQKMMDGDGADL